jgi:hypothetical protein
LLEAFQAVAKHGVLCPVDWKPSTNMSDTINTISNMLIESYEERLANLQKEFSNTSITDLDPTKRQEEEEEEEEESARKEVVEARKEAERRIRIEPERKSGGKEREYTELKTPDAWSKSQSSLVSTVGLTDSKGAFIRAPNPRSVATNSGVNNLPLPLSPSPGLHHERSSSAPASARVAPMPMPTASTQYPPPVIVRTLQGGTARH